MKYLIGFLVIVIASCNTLKYPLVPISKDCKNYIYSLTKDTLNNEWISETKSSNWKVVYVIKTVSNNYSIKTKCNSTNYQGFFITVFLDCCLKIKMVGKEINN